jgi:hypothetical protein
MNTFITLFRRSRSEVAETSFLITGVGRHFNPFIGYLVSKKFTFFDFSMFR